MPWVEKYRPAKLEDLVAHEDIVAILTRLIDNDNLPHLLLYGPPGTGKVRLTFDSTTLFLVFDSLTVFVPVPHLHTILRHLP